MVFWRILRRLRWMAMYESDVNYESLGLDRVLPCQFPAYYRSLYVRSGEQRLMLALLTDAINIILKGGRDTRLLKETHGWVCSNSRDSHKISFDQACDALGLDAERLRARLKELSQQPEKNGSAARRSMILKFPERFRRTVAPGGTLAMKRSAAAQLRSHQ
jgi:hypothetical protein